VDKFAEAVAQLAASREPIAPTHTNIEETMHWGNPLSPDLHIASAATAITYPAQYEFAGGSGGGGGGGGRGGGGGGDPDPDQPMNPDPRDNAPDPPLVAGGQPAYNLDEHPQSLCGSPPNIFDGTRDKVNSFLQAFGLYRAINCRHITMREPYNRIMMMLSYMKGPKIDDWVWERAMLLEMVVSNGTANLNDKHVWNTFIEEFTEAFTDTTRREQATLDLINIQMKGEDLDTYISTFHHLQERAGWELDAQGTILMFQWGLKWPLATAIVEQMHPCPQTLQGWYQAVRAHHAAYAENKATFANPFLRNDTCNQWEQALKGNKGKSWWWSEDAMDVDAVNTTGASGSGMQPWWGQYNWAAFLTNEERKTLLKERRCFNCQAQGHMSKQCPKKVKMVPTTLAIRTAETQGEPAPAYEGPPEPREEGGSQGNALDMICSMNNEERTKLLDDLCVEQGFWLALPMQPGYEQCTWIECTLAQ
jgi:Retrotransposon gag protein/Zinc knuckle